MKNILISDDLLNSHGILEITINRPKVLNSLDTETLREIVNTLHRHKDIAKVVVITGSEKSFSAGADISQMVNQGPVDQIKDDREFLWKEFNAYPFPIIAAVNGLCLGGGNELAMACDIIIAGDNARFGQPEINIGTTPGAGGTQRLTRAIGKARASYYALTGEMFSAEEAYQWGLVAKVVPYKTTLLEAKETAKKMALKSPLALKLVKEGIQTSFNTSLDEGLKLERRNFYLTFSFQDQKEGMNAFLEKRSPYYEGQ